jgi:hypothetical protein
MNVEYFILFLKSRGMKLIIDENFEKQNMLAFTVSLHRV